MTHGRHRGVRRGVVATMAILVGLSACSFTRTPNPDHATGAGQSGPPGEETPGSSDTFWGRGLATGPNGPVPVIVVDQFGYRPEASKVAVLRRPVTGYDAGSDYSPGSTLRLVDAVTGLTAFSGEATAWGRGVVDDESGDQAWWFDFSAVKEAGRYYVLDVEGGVRSPEFVIDDLVYAGVLRHALRTLFYQRAGQEKSAHTAGPEWSDGVSHVGPGQDAESRSWLDKDSAKSVRDLRGGWFDAGDYNKYTAWHASYLIALLRTHAENPTLVGDDYAIPESGNGVSDLLDEIAWGVAWLVRMQEPDGSVLCVQGLAHASPPSAATGPSHYGPATTNATSQASAALAFASTIFRGSGVPALAAQAPDLAQRALAVWEWAEANPSVTYFNNNDAAQPGSAGLAAGQQEVDDAGRQRSRFRAAVHLFEATGQPRFQDLVEDTFTAQLPDGGPSQWTVTEQEVLLHYASLPAVTPAVSMAIQSSYVNALTSGEQFLPAVRGLIDPYRAPMADYTWGSNKSKSAMGRMFALTRAYRLDADVTGEALEAAEDYLHYLHGVNPLGLVYLTNMAMAGAEHSATTLYHTWFADGSPWDVVDDSSPGPAPGFLVGGPNPAYSMDVCCADGSGCSGSGGACSQELSPPRGQPPMKAYLQFNAGWPSNSWEITENSNSYQVEYIRLLAMFAA